MSIRMIARDLYRLKQKVAGLEKKQAQAPVPGEPAVERELREARAEHDRLKEILEGAKDRP